MEELSLKNPYHIKIVYHSILDLSHLEIHVVKECYSPRRHIPDSTSIGQRLDDYRRLYPHTGV